ncbi:MAG: hypothetical protein QW474_01875 [Candidatus Aenigmatarchaeota archaeon]
MSKTISWLAIYVALLLTFVSLVLIIEKIIFRNCDGYFAVISLENNKVSTEIGQGKLIKGFIINKGFEDELKINVKGPEWVIVKPNRIRLYANQTEELFVYISPNLKGNFTAKIQAESFCQKHEETLFIQSK